jgi:hypothetical protein
MFIVRFQQKSQSESTAIEETRLRQYGVAARAVVMASRRTIERAEDVCELDARVRLRDVPERAADTIGCPKGRESFRFGLGCFAARSKKGFSTSFE